MPGELIMTSVDCLLFKDHATIEILKDTRNPEPSKTVAMDNRNPEPSKTVAMLATSFGDAIVAAAADAIALMVVVAASVAESHEPLIHRLLRLPHHTLALFPVSPWLHRRHR